MTRSDDNCVCVYIKHTGGDGIRKMEHEYFVACDAVTILCGLTCTAAYFCPREESLSEVIAWTDPHVVYTEPPTPDMMERESV